MSVMMAFGLWLPLDMPQAPFTWEHSRTFEQVVSLTKVAKVDTRVEYVRTDERQREGDPEA